MSWTSPLTVASTIVPLPWLSVFSMCGSRWATAFFITSADCEHERELHLPGPEQLADGLHPRQQRVVDDLQGGPLLQRGVEVGLEPVPLAVDDPPLQPLEQRQRRPAPRPGPAFAAAAVTPSNSSMNRLSGS